MRKNIIGLFSLILLLGLTSCGNVSESSSVANNSSSNSESISSEADSSVSTSSSMSSSTSSSSSSSSSISSSSPSSSLSSSDSSSSSLTSEEQEESLKYQYQNYSAEDVPSIRVTTADGSNNFATVPDMNNKWDYTDCSVSVDNCLDEYKISEATGGIKVRGNYTTNYRKKPLRIKFDSKQAMLGLDSNGKYKSWVLLADWKDSSMLRNAVSFYLGNTILGSDGYYCTDCRPVSVYLNGTYWGMYLLADQQEVKKGRVSIAEPEDDYQGTDIGYMFEYDGYYTTEESDPTFALTYKDNAPLKTVNGGTTTPAVKGYTIKNDITSTNQTTFISNYMELAYNAVYDAIYNNKFYEFNSDYTALVESKSTSKQEIVSSIIDVQSLVDTYIQQDIVCDADVSWSSFYLSADFSAKGSKKITFQAPWDFDSTLGLKRGICESGTGYFAGNSSNPWLVILANESWFKDMVKDKWNKLVKYNTLTNSLSFIDAYSQAYVNDYKLNYERWPTSIGKNDDVWGEVRDETANFKTEADAAKFLSDWMIDRYSYLDSVYGKGTLFGTGENEEPEANSVKYRYEAETFALNGTLNIHTGSGSSGDKYLGNIADQTGQTMTFNVVASADTKAFVRFGLSANSNDVSLSDWFSMSVNNQNQKLSRKAIPGVGDAFNWHNWTDADAGFISLKAGTNTIVLTTISAQTNLDYLDFYSTAVLS